MSKVIRVFMDSDLRCSHDGLAQVAKKHKLDVKALQDGEFIVFINSAKDRLKIYTSNNIIAYLKSISGKINLKTIQSIPSAFKGGRIDYDRILKAQLEKDLGSVERE